MNASRLTLPALLGAGLTLAGWGQLRAQAPPTPVNIAIPPALKAEAGATGRLGLGESLRLVGDTAALPRATLDLGKRLGLNLGRPVAGVLPAPPAFSTLAPEVLRVTLETSTAPLGGAGAPERLQLALHHSLLVESATPLTRVSLTDEAVAEAIVVSPYQILVQAHAPGEVTLLTWDDTAATHYYTIAVGIDTAPLQAQLAGAFPRAPITVSADGPALVLSGAVADAASAQRALALAGAYSAHVIDNLRVAAPPNPGQVLLQVRFAEVDRSAVSQFGANLLSTGAGNTVGSLGTGEYGAPSGSAVGATPSGGAPVSGSNVVSGAINQVIEGQPASFGLNSLLNIFLFRGDANLGLAIEALQQQNLVQILAEPNLVAVDGKDASFLAGGEFPFPVVQGTGGVNSVTIQFKPFGVNLHFKPTILADGTIDLQVAPEVSALDYTNAVTISGFTIPALSTRRAQTELELADGQSFLIAGLLDNRLTNSISKLPGLSQLPVLGKLFESHNFNKSKSELMVIVTAHLVQPGAQGNAPEPPKMPAPFLDGGKFDHSNGGGGPAASAPVAH